jgi:hypothetical protein
MWRTGDRVLVNTGGVDSLAVVQVPKYPWATEDETLRSSTLVAFENGTAQWIPGRYLRERPTEPTEPS